ncbi:MAG: HAMP domain-containing protein [Clostridia bacterium]|nr:HAMP domain-containing protein [Clostridia bacterium]
MKWYKNLNIRVKLMLAFIIIAFIAAFIGLVGYYTINDLGNEKMQGLQNIMMATEDFTRINALENLIISPKMTIAEREIIMGEIETAELSMNKHLNLYSALNLTQNERTLFNEVNKSIDLYIKSHDSLIEDAKLLNSYKLENTSELLTTLNARKADHYKWIWLLDEAMIHETEYTGNVDGTQCDLGKWLIAYKSQNKEMMTLIDEIDQYHMNVHESSNEINEVLNSDSNMKLEEAYAIYEKETLPNMDEVLNILDEMIALASRSDVLFGDMTSMSVDTNQPLYEEAALLISNLVEMTNDNVNNSVKSSILMIISLTIAGGLLSVALGFIISSMIKKPISVLASGVTSVANGDLNVEISIDTRDEIGRLGNAFKNMTENMNQVLSQINGASDQVASGSRQLSDSSMSLSQGATEQASSLEQLTASVEEISKQTESNAENANLAKKVSNETFTFAQRGQQQMSEMVIAMEEINASSTNISKIIKVIDDIAFQTNILALNAAVEAARAGVHGKGFAVVAEEVRNLAARSAEAAKSTTDLIENSVKQVNSGMIIARETATALKEIVVGVEKADKLMSEISRASYEQASGVSQVNLGLNQIADVVQTTSATAEETAAASEELSGQADLLKAQVSKFKLKAYKTDEIYGGGALSSEVSSLLDSMKVKKNTKLIAMKDDEFDQY